MADDDRLAHLDAEGALQHQLPFAVQIRPRGRSLKPKPGRSKAITR